jgi:hypothetical protein
MHFDHACKEQIIDIFTVYTQNKEKALDFYGELCKLNVKISVSLLQQYLMKYLDEPDKAIENIDELKKMFDASNVSKNAEETGLYS